MTDTTMYEPPAPCDCDNAPYHLPGCATLHVGPAPDNTCVVCRRPIEPRPLFFTDAGEPRHMLCEPAPVHTCETRDEYVDRVTLDIMRRSLASTGDAPGPTMAAIADAVPESDEPPLWQIYRAATGGRDEPWAKRYAPTASEVLEGYAAEAGITEYAIHTDTAGRVVMNPTMLRAYYYVYDREV